MALKNQRMEFGNPDIEASCVPVYPFSGRKPRFISVCIVELHPLIEANLIVEYGVTDLNSDF